MANAHAVVHVLCACTMCMYMHAPAPDRRLFLWFGSSAAAKKKKRKTRHLKPKVALGCPLRAPPFRFSAGALAGVHHRSSCSRGWKGGLLEGAGGSRAAPSAIPNARSARLGLAFRELTFKQRKLLIHLTNVISVNVRCSVALTVSATAQDPVREYPPSSPRTTRSPRASPHPAHGP